MIKDSPQRKARLIGTLFHDIGKFQYRAERTEYSHAEGSANFIREYLGTYTCLENILENAISIAENHHSSGGDYATQKGDSTSASERELQNKKEAKRPLISIFNHISNIRPIENRNKSQSFFKPGPLNLIEIFPEELKHEEVINENILREWHFPHWINFLNEVKRLPKNLKFRELFETLTALLEKWTSRVSSAGYYTLPDISLYDHSRVAAAYADCYAEADNKDYPFVIIEGDLSGIQKFIYRIANLSEGNDKGTAKTLRGRSFFIALLTDAIAQFILNKLNLYSIHLLLNGGGGFTIIAPNQKGIDEILNGIKKELNQWLYKQFHSEISIILIWKKFNEEQIVNFGEVKRNLLTAIGEAKYQKNLELFTDDKFWVSQIEGEGVLKLCRQCGIEPVRNIDRCPKCEMHRKIGEILPKIKTIIKINGLIKLPEEKFYQSFEFDVLGQTWVLLKEKHENQTLVDVLRLLLNEIPKDNSIDIIRINDFDFCNPELIKVVNETAHSISLKFNLLGLHVPKDETGDVLSFEQLAHSKQDSFPLLGVLRMDIDSLGAIFSFGFKEKHQTISRIANLSRLITLFFNGYLNVLAEKHNIYINYSGGDDLFVLGHWENIIQFAREVNNKFKKYVSDNPHLTISGGIIIIKPSFPIRFAAELAGDAEEKAKSLDQDDANKSKNAIAIFDRVVHWDRFENLIQWANGVVNLIQENDDNKPIRSLIRYFRQLNEESFDSQGNQNLHWIAKASHKIHYFLKRRANLGNKEVESPDTRKAELLSKVITDSKLMENIKIPADFILLKTRRIS